jgi:hypothetical protein
MSQVAQLLDEQLGDNIDFVDINCGELGGGGGCGQGQELCDVLGGAVGRGRNCVTCWVAAWPAGQSVPPSAVWVYSMD